MARSHGAPFQTNPLAKPPSCRSSDPCFTQTNKGTGAALEGVSLEVSPGAYGQAAILAQAKGIGGVYSFSQSSYGGEFESDGSGYALIAATDSTKGTAFIAENNANSFGPAIFAISKSQGAPAVVVQSATAAGLDVTTINGTAAEFATTGAQGVAIGAENVYSDGYLFSGQGVYGEAFLLDSKGDGDFRGVVSASAFTTNVREGSTLRATFGSQNTRASLEDTGSARLTNGQRIVRFDSAFAGVIDADAGYEVFLTPDGDTRGLYVSQKLHSGFIVREIEGGKNSIEFDYRIIGRPRGASGARLPEVHLRKPPRVTLSSTTATPEPGGSR